MNDPVSNGILVHVDAALRQISYAQQLQVVDELRRRIEERKRKGAARAAFEDRGCTGKVAHPTREDAAAARLRHGNARKLDIYECPRCSQWHLGHIR